MSTATETTSETKRKRSPLWWRVARGTIRGTGIIARIVYVETRFTYGVTKTRTRARYRAWKAERSFTADDSFELDEVPRRRRRLGREQYLCLTCGRKYSSTRGLNSHFENAHGSEKRPVDTRPPTRIRGTRSTGRVLVRPTPKTTVPSGHRPTSTRSASPMDSAIALAMKKAWQAMAEARPKFLSQIRADMVGLEQALGGYAAEGIDQYRAHLLAMGFDLVVVQRLVKAKQHLEEAGKQFSAVIAQIEDVYAADIAAAKKRKGGDRPSDDTLTR